MRRCGAMVRAAALEISSEPLALLLTLGALALGNLAPALHYHQFGEPSRMARDATLSSLLVFGLLFAVFCTGRAFRREIESGTAEMALTRPISRANFFLSHLLGAYGAYLFFALTLTASLVTAVNGAEIGGRVAEETHDLARTWGPSLACGLAPLVLAPLGGGILNRFAGFRFVPTAYGMTGVISVLAMFYRFDASLAMRLLPAAVMLLLPAAVFAAASAAFSVRWSGPTATTVSGLMLGLSLPVIGNYCLSDSLAWGGTISWGYVATAAALTIPLVAAFAYLGVRWFGEKDVSYGR